MPLAARVAATVGATAGDTGTLPLAACASSPGASATVPLPLPLRQPLTVGSALSGSEPH